VPSEDGRFLHVYYGLERLEVVPAAADHPAHRMLIARLYNADVKVAVLEELFDLDHKTIRAWGLALDSGDPEALQRMLFGAPRKLTPAIREFIAGRWPQLRTQRCRNHREVLQNEIKAYFGVKGYTPGPWDETRATTRFGVERPRNNSRDVRLYQFSVIDQPWAHNPAMRQLIVRATNAEGNVAQIAVLTDDLERSAKEMVWLIFNRWVQENDFKYVDKHMGMKQITSYKSIDYSELRDHLVDRQVPNELYVQKIKEGRRLIRRKARLLLAEDTRCDDSRTAASGKPTIMMMGLSAPWALTSTSTSWASTPRKAAEKSRVII